ncbi:hypothetical protein ABC347_07535 [Sphingomonas sp. 1P06PA]|uniref:hypothetical protein n=1 Tax=Sphingomonas sp. 1P06PA TaxID=554121 RepID=UPI0039A5136B
MARWLVATSLGGLALAAQAQTPPGLSDLVGARAAGGETQLEARGFRSIRTSTDDDRKYSSWWNAERRQCVMVATSDGRYASITTTPAADCDQRTAAVDRRDDRYRPQPIAQRGASGIRQSPSYAQDRGAIQVGGNEVDLGLVCFGDGQRPGLATTYGWSWNSRRDRYDYGNRTELEPQQFDASVMIQLWGDGGRISLPKKLIPPINTRGQDGWWDLYDVETGPDLIRARYRLNGLNKPSITINRRSGQITIVGTQPYGFRGTCDLIDGDDHRRF